MVKFVDPPEKPAPTRKSSKWVPILDEVKARPNTWALIAENVWASLATGLRRGNFEGVETEGLEIRTVYPDDYRYGKTDVYARYNRKVEE